MQVTGPHPLLSCQPWVGSKVKQITVASSEGSAHIAPKRGEMWFGWTGDGGVRRVPEALCWDGIIRSWVGPVFCVKIG